MTLPALLLPNESRWTVMNGDQKGIIHSVTQRNFVIGRSSECDLVIVNDPKCSRKHARVDWTDEGFVVQSLSGSNELKVNGESVSKSLLRDQDLITLGETDLLFNMPNVDAPSAGTRPSVSLHSVKAPPQLEIVPRGPAPMHPGMPPGMPPMPPPAPAKPAPSRTVQQKKFTNKQILMWGSVLLLVGWLLNSEVSKRKTENIRTSEQIDADIKEAEKLHQLADADRKKRLGDTTEIRQAKEMYVKGFRDYKKGQYERAVESFQACLSLYTDDILCNRYVRLAQKKFDELIEAKMVLGRKYRDQGLYSECMSSFQNVMFMVKDFNSPRYKEAKANFEACNAFVEGRRY